MQLLKKILEKRRFKADDLIMGELDLMIKLISLISKSDFQEGKTQSTQSIDSILETELEYKKHSDLFIQEFEKSSLPFFWQDIFYVGMAEVFERINNENRIINDLLRKIIIGTNI